MPLQLIPAISPPPFIRERLSPARYWLKTTDEIYLRIKPFLRQFIGDLFVEDVFDGQGDDGFAGFSEEGVNFSHGVPGVIEGDEEALGAVFADHDVGIFIET